MVALAARESCQAYASLVPVTSTSLIKGKCFVLRVSRARIVRMQLGSLLTVHEGSTATPLRASSNALTVLSAQLSPMRDRAPAHLVAQATSQPLKEAWNVHSVQAGMHARWRPTSQILAVPASLLLLAKQRAPALKQGIPQPLAV